MNPSESQETRFLKFSLYCLINLLALRLVQLFIDYLNRKPWIYPHEEVFVLVGAQLVLAIAALILVISEKESWVYFILPTASFSFFLSLWTLTEFYLKGFGFNPFYYFAAVALGLILVFSISFVQKKRGS